jgi:hypothetical protein
VRFPLADLVPSGDPAVGGYIGLMLFGFLVGIAGHIIKSNAMIATGIGLIFIAVLLLPLLLHGGG